MKQPTFEMFTSMLALYFLLLFTNNAPIRFHLLAFIKYFILVKYLFFFSNLCSQLRGICLLTLTDFLFYLFMSGEGRGTGGLPLFNQVLLFCCTYLVNCTSSVYRLISQSSFLLLIGLRGWKSSEIWNFSYRFFIFWLFVTK